MRTVFFQAALVTTLFLVSPASGQYALLNQTASPQYSHPDYPAALQANTLPNPYAIQQHGGNPDVSKPPTIQRRSNYPLISPAGPQLNNGNFSVSADSNRHAIQRPEYYGVPRVQGTATQRVFSHANKLTQYPPQSPVRVAANPRLRGYESAREQGYRQGVTSSPQGTSTSTLPLPGLPVYHDDNYPGARPSEYPGNQGHTTVNPNQPFMTPQLAYQEPQTGASANQNVPGNQILPGGNQPGQVTAPATGVAGNYDAGFCGGCQGRMGIVAPGCCNPGVWFGSLGGLVFNRDYEDDHVFAYPAGLPLVNSLVSTQADLGAMGGVEATVGRRFCNGFGVEAVYWGLFPEESVATAIGGNPRNNWATANYLDYRLSTMDVYMNNSIDFQIRRVNEFHNVELNFFRQSCCAGDDGCCGPGLGFARRPAFGMHSDCQGAGCGNAGCSSCQAGLPRVGNGGWLGRPVRFDLLAGIRFFRFDEDFFFRTTTTGDYTPHINDINYELDVENNLIGFQLGGNVEYGLFQRWAFVGSAKLGVYGNSMTQRQRIYGLAGYASANQGAFSGQDYNLRSTKTDVAFLSQLDLGLRYAISSQWSLGFGYRVVAVSGVALAPNQIPYDFSHYQEANAINSNSGLILHGGYLRVGYNF